MSVNDYKSDKPPSYDNCDTPGAPTSSSNRGDPSLPYIPLGYSSPIGANVVQVGGTVAPTPGYEEGIWPLEINLSKLDKEQQESINMAKKLLNLKADPQTKQRALDFAMRIFELIKSGASYKTNRELWKLRLAMGKLYIETQIEEAKELSIRAQHFFDLGTPEAIELRNSIKGYIESGRGLELTKEQKDLMELTRKLLKLELTSEQQKIAMHVFNYLADTEDIGGVVFVSSEYRDAHRLHRPGLLFFRKLSEADSAILDIYELAKKEFEREREAQETSASSASSSKIMDFESFEDEDF